ncbi:MAG TPA: hypothetical protein VG454_07390 [Gemmatimonadales bacterium]|nr:hypothetical protein [Gemmatimonadales bacterium]
MIDRRRAIMLLGETARDVGILVLVFSPLDALFERGGPEVVVVILLGIMALILVAAGIMLEAWELRR